MLSVQVQVQTQLANHVAAVLPAILVGLACGVLGTIFTLLNVKVVRLRDAIIQVLPAALLCHALPCPAPPCPGLLRCAML